MRPSTCFLNSCKWIYPYIYTQLQPGFPFVVGYFWAQPVLNSIAGGPHGLLEVIIHRMPKAGCNDATGSVSSLRTPNYETYHIPIWMNAFQKRWTIYIYMSQLVLIMIPNSTNKWAQAPSRPSKSGKQSKCPVPGNSAGTLTFLGWWIVTLSMVNWPPTRE